jgi:hypothetical protein
MVKDYKREREYRSHQGFHESKFVTVGAAMLSNDGCDYVIIINNALLYRNYSWYCYTFVFFFLRRALCLF